MCDKLKGMHGNFFFQLEHLFVQVTENVVKLCQFLLRKNCILILELESCITLYSPTMRL